MRDTYSIDSKANDACECFLVSLLNNNKDNHLPVTEYVAS
jgi:hypothetical protein